MSSRKSRMPSSSRSRSRSSSDRKSKRSSSSNKRSRTSGKKHSSASSSRKRSRAPSSAKRSSGKKDRISESKKSRSSSVGKKRTLLSRKIRTPAESTKPRKSSRRHKSSSSSSEPRGSTERTSKSKLCNLKFPVARVKSMLKVHNHGLRVSDKAAVFTTAVLEYLTTEILELSTNAARGEERSRIQTRHVNKAIKTDFDLFRNFKNSSVPNSNFISLNEMIQSQHEMHSIRQRQTEALPEPSAESVATSETRQTGRKSATRREG